ncbi:DNA excision repair protein ERCC-6-like [Scleropages formosus]|uniref:DNA excision repair protein ERCC-6-like n=1 Tax=Scleropages formosus TaxID=113540 RepID=A0A0P7V1M0_SCLFO|nr:DNA excision repair protein ERCC-6-like [Scleropages formosus]
MEEEEEQFEDVLNSGFKLYKELHDQLYDYQLSGLVFLYKAYEQGKKGVILADEMGLGKSIQVITFLSGMMDTEQIKNVLLVMPITLKKDWTDKLNKWTPGIKWQFYHKTEENSTRNLRNVQMGGDVLLTSYRMLVHHQTSLSRYKNKPFTWDCVIYDEAHELKNHTTKTFMAATAIPAKFKILLTGMPVQSKLQELWALFSIVAPSGLLGSYNDYKKLYKDPITRATEAYASPRERTSGKEILWRLQKKIEPYFLRRTKDKILHSKNSCRLVQLNCKETPHLPKKTELVVWIRLSPEQETMYRELILSRGPLNKACYSLQDVNTLKSICNHPRQLEENYLHHLPTGILLAESGKLTFLISLLRRLMEDGHRILVFSQFPKMLDIIQYVLEKKKLGPFLRIDGKTHLQERERQCELFQENSCYKIFFFTTKVGAIGLTLTSASRVVIVDPSWNQEVDSQAVNQAYRIGQKEKVVVYRLITCGTVEEKMYRKQQYLKELLLVMFLGKGPLQKRGKVVENLKESEESQAEDGNNTETKRITQSIDTPSEPQTNTEMASVRPMQTTFSFESPMPAQKRSKNSRMPSIRCSQITFSAKPVSEKIDKDQRQSQPRLILGELQHKDLKQNCSSASPLLMDHPFRAPTPVDTGYLENFHRSELSTHLSGQSTSSGNMVCHTSHLKTSVSVAEKKIICSGEASADHTNGQYIESRMNNSQNRAGDLATDGRLIAVLENLLQILKK